MLDDALASQDGRGRVARGKVFGGNDATGEFVDDYNEVDMSYRCSGKTRTNKDGTVCFSTQSLERVVEHTDVLDCFEGRARSAREHEQVVKMTVIKTQLQIKNGGTDVELT